MKIIAEFTRGLKYIEYNGKDVDELKERFKKIDVERLCNWLTIKNKTLLVKDCYDSQSGWTGAHFIINGEDLSGNGYCLNNDRVMKFIEDNK
jgi:hypothetical protein